MFKVLLKNKMNKIFFATKMSTMFRVLCQQKMLSGNILEDIGAGFRNEEYVGTPLTRH